MKIASIFPVKDVSRTKCQSWKKNRNTTQIKYNRRMGLIWPMLEDMDYSTRMKFHQDKKIERGKNRANTTTNSKDVTRESMNTIIWSLNMMNKESPVDSVSWDEAPVDEDAVEEDPSSSKFQ